MVAINASDSPFTASCGELNGTVTELLSNTEMSLAEKLEMPAYSIQYLVF